MKKHRAFTLIELLVVVAIIALLIAMLMPQLSKARQQAQKTRCLANLHGIGLAINMYLTQNRDITPEQLFVNIPVATFQPGATSSSGNGYVNGVWVEQLVADGCASGSRIGAPYQTILQQYEFCGRGIFLCPSSVDQNNGLYTNNGFDANGDFPLATVSSGRPNNGYGLNPNWCSILNYDGSGARIAPSLALVGQTDPGIPYVAKANYSTEWHCRTYVTLLQRFGKLGVVAGSSADNDVVVV